MQSEDIETEIERRIKQEQRVGPPATDERSLETIIQHIKLAQELEMSQGDQIIAEYHKSLRKDEARRRNLIRIALQRRALQTKISEIQSDRKMKKLDKMIAIRDLRREISNL